ncbi:MAG TPA: T9SS type A sorting domain-containing protein [Bacteroidia bacterium]|nr:T9SS type A sorting domain-containing protein [Bacteroidia bacterium]
MKKLLLIAMVLTGLSAKAQYFHHTYGSSWGNEFLRSGVNTVLQGQGHFIAGHHRLTCLQPLSVIPTAFTDVDGTIPGAPYFARNFILSRPNGAALHAMGAQAFELDDASGFGLIGMYIDFSITSGSNTGIFYIQLDPNGDPLNVYEYTVGNTNYRVSTVEGIAETTFSGSNDVYITGSVSDNSSTYPYAMKIDYTNGSIVWSSVYDILTSVSHNELSRAVCESPYTPFGTAEIVVVGTVVDYAGSNTPDGFLMHVDAGNGSLLAPVNLYGTNSSQDEFSSIRVSSNTTAGSAGFIIGGYTDLPGDMDFWVVNTDDAGNVNFSTAFNYTPNGGYNQCHDVIERFNTWSNYEYYAVGYAQNGIFGGSDIMVVKIDDGGNGISEFTYGGPNGDIGLMLDQNNGNAGANPDGLSVYGRWGGTVAGAPETDMYIVKAYFSGHSGCNEKTHSTTQTSSPGLLSTVSASTLLSFNSGTLAISYLSLGNTNLCYNLTLPGSNARVAPDGNEEEKAGVLLIPNPAESGITDVEIVVESEEPGEADVTIYDMAGRQVYKGRFVMARGANSLKLDISKSHLTPGMYTVQVNGAVSDQTILLQVN